MPATIVVGGQYGSEGKGKVVALLCRARPIACVVRCGGPNSGHTTTVGGNDVVLRQLPASIGVSRAKIAICAGAVIDEEILEREVATFGISRSELIIDPRASVVTVDDKLLELGIAQSIGSTASGNGYSLVRRMLREDAVIAQYSSRLNRIATIEPVAPMLHKMNAAGDEVVIEGTQGFGLSLLHGSHFPYVTSKDTTAAAFAAEAGISPRDVGDIILVIRTFPIRVGGNSGPLANEISWEAIQRSSDAPSCEVEYTSVTRKVRRVGQFDLQLVRSAIAYNKPTALAVMGLDRIDFQNRSVRSVADLSPAALEFLRSLTTETGTPLAWIGTGFGTDDAFHVVEKFNCFMGALNV